MSTGRTSCPPAWETALLHLVSFQNLQPMPLCNATNNLVGYVAVVHDCQTMGGEDFSEFLERCLAEGPQLVTRRGTEAAVLVPVEEWRRLQAAARPSR